MPLDLTEVLAGIEAAKSEVVFVNGVLQPMDLETAEALRARLDLACRILTDTAWACGNAAAEMRQ